MFGAGSGLHHYETSLVAKGIRDPESIWSRRHVGNDPLEAMPTFAMGNPLSEELFALSQSDKACDAGTTLRGQRQLAGSMGQAVAGLRNIGRADSSRHREGDLVLFVPEWVTQGGIVRFEQRGSRDLKAGCFRGWCPTGILSESSQARQEKGGQDRKEFHGMGDLTHAIQY